jgi:c-di-GMP-binding flagellar brake protein YcgR
MISISAVLENKRKHPRFEVSTPVSFVAHGKLRIASTENLSQGGMRLCTRYLLFMNQVCDFNVVISARAIRVQGRVVYIQDLQLFDYGVGVCFSQLSPEDQNHLSRYLTGLSREQHPLV